MSRRLPLAFAFSSAIFALAAMHAAAPSARADDGSLRDGPLAAPRFEDGDDDADADGEDAAADAPTRGNPDSAIEELEELEGTEIAASTPYNAGQRLKVSMLGVSFAVPEGCVAGFIPGGVAIVVQSETVPGIGLVAMQTGITLDETTAFLSGKLDLSSIEAGAVLDPEDEPVVDGDRLAQVFKNETYTAHAVSIVAKQSGVTFLFAGAHDDSDKTKALAEAMADSARFAAPDDAEQREQWVDGLKGKRLHVYIYTGSSTSGMSHSAETNITWDLGSDFAYDFAYKFEGSANVEGRDYNGDLMFGAGSANADNAEHSGTWRIEFSLVAAVLVLTDSDGKSYIYSLALAGNKLYVNGNEATISQSQQRR